MESNAVYVYKSIYGIVLFVHAQCPLYSVIYVYAFIMHLLCMYGWGVGVLLCNKSSTCTLSACHFVSNNVHSIKYHLYSYLLKNTKLLYIFATSLAV